MFEFLFAPLFTLRAQTQNRPYISLGKTLNLKSSNSDSSSLITSANMWELAVILTISVVVCYLFLEKINNLGRERPRSGSEPWQLGSSIRLDIAKAEICATTQGCKDILASAWMWEESTGLATEPGHGQLSLLETRAGPNIRLAESFEIENPFTTIDEEYYKNSRMKMVRLLKTSDEDWRMLWNWSKEIARNGVAKQGSKATIPLVPLVQSVVFQVVMRNFFPDASKRENDVAIANITRLINQIWVDSKRRRKDPQNPDLGSGILAELGEFFKLNRFLDSDTRSLAALKRNLARVLPTWVGKKPRESPLNIILPTYETLWRVVFHCTVEVLFRHEDRSGAWKSCLGDFGQILDTEAKFSIHAALEHRPCIMDISKEALRLYPPTKRIYRWSQVESAHGGLDGHPDNCAADIEAVHRDPQIWGPDAAEFRPERWSGYTAEERKRVNEAFMPFGHGSMSCPAKDFAPKMIGLIVAALVGELGDGFEWVAGVAADRIDGAGPLRTERNSYETLGLRRM